MRYITPTPSNVGSATPLAGLVFCVWMKGKAILLGKEFLSPFLCLVPLVRVSLMFPTDLKSWYSKGVVREAVLLNLEN